MPDPLSRDNPRNLDRKRALEIMFPEYVGSPEAMVGAPPILTWKAWSPPSVPKDIDEVVTRIIKKGILRSREQWDQMGLGCPYYIARLAVAEAAVKAAEFFKNYKDGKETAGPAAKAICDAAKGHIDPISGFVQNHSNWLSVIAIGNGRLGELDDLKAMGEDCAALQADFETIRQSIDAFRRVSKIMSKWGDALAPAGSPGDIWRLTFVDVLNTAWVRMTGESSLRPSGQPTDFLNCAYTSIGGSGTHKSEWATPIKTIVGTKDQPGKVERRPEWRRPDSIVSYAVPPGMSKDIWDAAQIEAVEYAVEDSIARKIVGDALSGVPHAGAAATVFYRDGSARLRKYIEALGWTAELRAAHPTPNTPVKVGTGG